MLSNAFGYPLADDDRLKTHLIGSLLVVGSVLVVPLFVLLGYFVRTVNHAIDGRPVPRFEAYGELIVDGLKLTGIGIAYFLGLLVAMFGVALLGSLSETAGTVGFLLLVPAYFGLLYVSTSVLYHFARRRRIGDAFDLRAVAGTALSLRYLLVVVLVWVVLPTAFAVLQVLIGLTIVGLLLIPATLVYELIVYGKLIGDLEP